jgi:hypothetical protein
MPAYTIEHSTVALQQNPQLKADLAAMLQQNGDTRSPEQWLIDDVNAGDTNSTFIGALEGAKTGSVNVPEPGGGNSDGFGSLIAPTTGDQPFVQAPAPAVSGGNYNQVQNAKQGGQFATVGSNIQRQTGTTEQTQAGTQVGTQGQTTSGTSTTTPNDTLGFGALLQEQARPTIANDAERTAFLRDVMQTGGTGFNQQLDAGIRNSLTGPQMTGAGDSARARAAGYAAANVGRNNLDQRITAANSLTNPGGFTSLVNASTPFMGQTQTSSGSSDSISNLMNSSKTTGFQDLLTKGSEAQAGTTTGQSSQAGAGQIPQGQPVKTGGCVLCTAAYEMKLPKSNILRVLRRVIRHKLVVDRSAYASAARGYFALFTPVARWLLTKPRFARALYPLARATVYEELRLSGRRLPWKAVPWVVHWLGHHACGAVGFFLPLRGVTDPVITDIARRNNILFEVSP